MGKLYAAMRPSRTIPARIEGTEYQQLTRDREQTAPRSAASRQYGQGPAPRWLAQAMLKISKVERSNPAAMDKRYDRLRGFRISLRSSEQKRSRRDERVLRPWAFPLSGSKEDEGGVFSRHGCRAAEGEVDSPFSGHGMRRRCADQRFAAGRVDEQSRATLIENGINALPRPARMNRHIDCAGQQ